MARYLDGDRGTSNPLVPRLREDPVSGSSRVRHCINHCLLVVVEHLLESVEVEAVADVFLVHLTEELMVLETAEPTYPPVALL